MKRRVKSVQSGAVNPVSLIFDPARPFSAKPPEKFTFFDLERLARVDPGRSTARWEEVKEAARRDLSSGWLAGRALEFMGRNAWERACFLAVRGHLRQAWPPRDDGEPLLINEMAQYEMVRRQWIGILAMLSREPRTILSLERQDNSAEKPRRMTAADATREAVRMVERLHRLYHATLRTLLSLRRSQSPVIVRRAGQVNVAERQINLAAPEFAPTLTPAE